MASDRAQQGSAPSHDTEKDAGDQHPVLPHICQASDIPESLFARMSAANENATVVDGDALLQELEADMARATPAPPQGGNAQHLALPTLVGMGAHMESEST